MLPPQRYQQPNSNIRCNVAGKDFIVACHVLPTIVAPPHGNEKEYCLAGQIFSSSG
jgi:hypothetical protein